MSMETSPVIECYDCGEELNITMPSDLRPHKNKDAYLLHHSQQLGWKVYKASKNFECQCPGCELNDQYSQ